MKIKNNPTKTEQIFKLLSVKLDEFNAKFIDIETHEFCLYIEDNEKTVKGGIVGEKYGKVLYIHLLWVDETLRGSGKGSELLIGAEKWAFSKNCTSIVLDTFSFQAPGFYISMGYTPFGGAKIDEDNHSRIYFQKIIS